MSPSDRKRLANLGYTVTGSGTRWVMRAADGYTMHAGDEETAWGCAAAHSRWEGASAFVASVARLPHEDELEDGMSGDDANDTVNSLITWARELAPQTPGHPANQGKGL